MDVNFNDENQMYASRSGGPQTSAFVRLMMKFGAKSEESANYALIGVAVACIILAIIVYVTFVK